MMILRKHNYRLLSTKSKLRLFSSSSSITDRTLSKSTTTFGDVKVVNNTIDTEIDLIPKSFLLQATKLPSEIKYHLRWIAQKYNQRQDCCLIGHPSSLKRDIVIKFCEEVGLEVEFLSITRDTVASDLKQRREIFGNSILFVDQPVVRAAKHGRVLILDGLEKAERNVLPTLNNLLENREMNLDDGSVLISHDNYEKIVRNDNSSIKKSQLIPVNENFFVISLVTPTPPYVSSTSISLDPPLRSRFQCRYIDELKTDTLVSLFSNQYSIDDRFTKVMSFYETLRTLRSSAMNDDIDNSLSLLPIFSLRNVYDSISMISKENLSAEKAIQKSILPFHMMKKYIPDKYKSRIEQIYDSYNLNNVHVDTPTTNSSLFSEQIRILNDLNIDNKIGKHMLILGDKGIGKSFTAEVFKKNFEESHIMQIYSELSPRDILQRRVTDDNGNSIWTDSPLTTAARRGHLVILDGFDRLEISGLSVIKRLLNDNTLDLPSGERVTAHPNFRLLALALPPKSASEFRDRYLQSDLPFSYNYINGTVVLEDKLKQLSSLSSSSSLHKVAKAFTQSNSEFQLSLKNIIRLERMLESKRSTKKSSNSLLNMMIGSNSNNDRFLIDKVEDMLMVKYMPPTSLKKFKGIVDSLHLETKSVKQKSSSKNIHPLIIEDGKYLQCDDVKVVRCTSPNNPEKVPQPLYFDNNTHSLLMKDLLTSSFTDGKNEPVLIIGSQGVGKNKIVDKILQLLNKEKEYIQLHRDSTIHSLTVLPTLLDGKIIYEDSPLVKAVKYGRCLVVDEVDKASSEVVFVLKALAEEQDIYLGDGRRIISKSGDGSSTDNDVIKHDDFRLVLLANPGIYPFHGNDFFKHCGDSFIPFVMNELDLGSETALLKRFGPNVDVKHIADIALTFMDLRKDYNSGSITYPFSTRESVSIIKHLQAYPQDGISSAIENVIAFDSLTPSLKNYLIAKFKERGISISKEHEEQLLNWEIVKERNMMNKSDPRTGIGSPKHGKVDPKNKPHVGGNTWAGGSGGSDTAGLGGRGGPYRLDVGHDVHQVSDEEKSKVSQQVRDEAARLAKEGLVKRLEEIKMQKFEYNAYMMFKKKIENEVSQLREIFMSNKNNNERSWMRNQSQGEIDENKLVDGILGEKNIYKKRAPPDSPESKRLNQDKFSKNNKRKRFNFIVDVSASMYRFQGVDQRLERMIEVVLLILESMPTDSHLYDYSITGHSGDSSQIKFVEWGVNKPQNEKERFEVLQSMIAHSQYCLAGDHTIKATKLGQQNLKKVLKDDNDIEGYNFIFSDANFDRYDIQVDTIKNAMESNDPYDRIKSHMILIASLEEEAARIIKALPIGSAHTCFNSNDLPKVFKNILLETLK